MSGAAVRGGNVVIADVIKNWVVEDTLLSVVLLSDVPDGVDEFIGTVDDNVVVKELDSIVEEVRSELDEDDSDVGLEGVLVADVVGLDEVMVPAEWLVIDVSLPQGLGTVKA
jgi:hypothetical protein